MTLCHNIRHSGTERVAGRHVVLTCLRSAGGDAARREGGLGCEAKKCLFIWFNYIIRQFFRTFALYILTIKNSNRNIGTQKNIQRYTEGRVFAIAWRTDTLLDVS